MVLTAEAEQEAVAPILHPAGNHDHRVERRAADVVEAGCGGDKASLNGLSACQERLDCHILWLQPAECREPPRLVRLMETRRKVVRALQQDDYAVVDRSADGVGEPRRESLLQDEA